MRSMVKFIEEGDKVKVTMRFRGRELAHQELGMDVLMRVTRRSRRDRQGRAVPSHGRPPDDHGHVAEIGPAARDEWVRRPLAFSEVRRYNARLENGPRAAAELMFSPAGWHQELQNAQA